MWNAWGTFWGDSWGTSWGPLHEVAESWDTNQGISPGWLKFEPVRSSTARPRGLGSVSGSNRVVIECRSVVVATVRGYGAFARQKTPDVSTAAFVRPVPRGASSGSRKPSVTASAALKLRGRGASARGNRARAFGTAEVCASGLGAYAQSGFSSVFTVKNPTDEELLLIFRRMVLTN